MVAGATTFGELATPSAEGTGLLFLSNLSQPCAEVTPFGHLDPFVLLYLVDRLGDGPGDDPPGGEGDEESDDKAQ